MEAVELPDALPALPSAAGEDFAPPASVAAGTAAGCVGLGASENSEHADNNVVKARASDSAVSGADKATTAGRAVESGTGNSADSPHRLRSIECRDDILRQLRLAVTSGFQLGQRLEALLHPLVVDTVFRARGVQLVRLDGLFLERETPAPRAASCIPRARRP